VALLYSVKEGSGKSTPDLSNLTPRLIYHTPSCLLQIRLYHSLRLGIYPDHVHMRARAPALVDAQQSNRVEVSLRVTRDAKVATAMVLPRTLAYADTNEGTLSI
jgi:hypothetical protein